MSLDRFRTAQDQAAGGFATAMDELRRGSKQSHWIWYIFPQLAGLGRSSMAGAYAIADAAEARAYLLDPVLGGRLAEAASVVAAHLKRGVPLATLMGSEIDAIKLVSSLTLFGHVARELADADAPHLSGFVRDVDIALAAAAAQGYPPCDYTLDRLGR